MTCHVVLGTQPSETPPHELQRSVQFPALSTVLVTSLGAAGPSTLVRTSSGSDPVPRAFRYAVTTTRYAVSGNSPIRLMLSWPCTVAVPGACGAPPSSAVAVIVYVDGTQSWVSSNG